MRNLTPGVRQPAPYTGPVGALWVGLNKKKKKKKNVYFDRMFLVRRPTIKAYNEAASMQVT